MSIEQILLPSTNGTAIGNGSSNGSGGNSHKPRFRIGQEPGKPIAVAVTQLAAQKEPTGQVSRLVREIESDPQFLFGYSIVQALVQTAKVTIEIDGNGGGLGKDDPRAKALADNLTKRWTEALPHACRAFAYGRAAFEQYFERYDPATNLRLLGPLDALEYDDTRMLVQDGEYAGCEVKHGDKSIDLMPSQSWWFALDATPKLPMGRSRYSGTPWKVLQKRKALEENWSIFAGKNANGTAVIKAPSQYPNSAIGQKGEAGEVDSNGQPLNPLVDMGNQWINLKAGGAMVMPSETDPTDQHSLFEMSLEPGQSNPAGLESRQRMLDDEVLKSLGIPPRAVEQAGPAGSYSLSQTHMEVLRALISGILSQMTASYQQQVVDQAVKLNFAGGVKLWVVYQDLDPILTATVIDLIKTILASRQMSLLVSQGAVDIAKLLEIANLPAGADVAGALARIKHIEEQSAVAMVQPTGAGGATPPTNGPQGVQMSLLPAVAAATVDDPRENKTKVPPPSESWPDALEEMVARIQQTRSNLSQTLGDSQDWGSL